MANPLTCAANPEVSGKLQPSDKTTAGQADPTCSENGASAVILWPALGCPQLVDPEEPALEVILLSKEPAAKIKTSDYVKKLLNQIFVLQWQKALEPYRKDGGLWDLGTLKKIPLANLVGDGADRITYPTDPRSLDDYEKEMKEGPLQFGNLWHTIASVVPDVYKKKCFKSIVTLRLKLRSASRKDKANTPLGDFELRPGTMFTLYYEPENVLLQDILKDEKGWDKPYDTIPLMQGTSIGGHNLVYGWRHDHKAGCEQSRYGDRKREHAVRLFHPFQVVRKEARTYLNVGHITDLHISTLWDYFDERLFSSVTCDASDLTAISSRTPADSTRELISKRYNNPNLNVRDLTRQLNSGMDQEPKEGKINKYVDIILQTGDLIDFNRGFNLNPRHEPGEDYLFNLNWIRYYELLLLDYERPTYTLLGNHDLRLNPYPPQIRIGITHWIALLGFCTLVFTIIGTVYGALKDIGDGKGAGFLRWAVPIIAAFPVAYGLALGIFGWGVGAGTISALLTSGWGLVGFWVGVPTLAAVLVLCLYSLDKREGKEKVNAGTGALSGGLFGLGLLSLIALCFMKTLFWKHNYMTRITNLLSGDLVTLLDDKNVVYLNALYTDGLFYMTERAADWYSLVVNPFTNYAYRHRDGNMSVMMGNWSGDEILLADPPVADDMLTPQQRKLFAHWTEWSDNARIALNQAAKPKDPKKAVVSILCLHTPVFCPDLDEKLNNLHKDGVDTSDWDLERGTFGVGRKDVIDKMFRMGKDSISAISLTGHTHDYDIFRIDQKEDGERGKVKWYQAKADFNKDQTDFWNRDLHITTTSAGPPSDADTDVKESEDTTVQVEKVLRAYDENKDNTFDEKEHGKLQNYKEGWRVERASGCRMLSFDPNTGMIVTIEEISSKTAKWGTRES